MIIDNTAGLQYLFNDDIYLLSQDMDSIGGIPQPVTVTDEVIPEIMAEQPVTVITEQPVVSEPPALYFKYLGGNAKQFLILCSYDGIDHMDEKHLAALTNALSRKELTLDDVAILNLKKHAAATITELQEYFKPGRLLLLGAPSLLSGWDELTLNRLESLTGIKALYTYSFAEMMGDRDKTKAFWEQMKVL